MFPVKQFFVFQGLQHCNSVRNNIHIQWKAFKMQNCFKEYCLTILVDFIIQILYRYKLLLLNYLNLQFAGP